MLKSLSIKTQSPTAKRLPHEIFLHMKQGARLKAVITLIEKVLASSTPADAIITGYFRQCRYMGAGDRRDISQTVYQILRRYEELSWYLQNAPENKLGWGRLLVFTYIYKIQNLSIPEIQALCQGHGESNKFDPAPLSTLELMLLNDMERLMPKTMPLATRLNMPAWAMPYLEKTFGDQLEEAADALNQSAPFDLRVNTLKTTRDAILIQLQAEGFEAMPTPWSPIGIRLPKRRPLSGHDIWKQGSIEVQDEGSQLLALLADAKSGMTVIDFCAGAGGKTLAMAATMQNRGRIVATDVAQWRLDRSRERLRRAGVNNVEFRGPQEATAKWLKRQSGRFDRVLIDAPCSGSGTWRRNPDLKRRFSQQDLDELLVKQQQILKRAAPLVKEGGRLIYATCSLFLEENTSQIEKFLEIHSDFRLIPIKEIWSSVLNTPCPTASDTLQLTPHLHAVDGFFIAVLERMKSHFMHPSATNS